MRQELLTFLRMVKILCISLNEKIMATPGEDFYKIRVSMSQTTQICDPFQITRFHGRLNLSSDRNIAKTLRIVLVSNYYILTNNVAVR